MTVQRPYVLLTSGGAAMNRALTAEVCGLLCKLVAGTNSEPVVILIQSLLAGSMTKYKP